MQILDRLFSSYIFVYVFVSVDIVPNVEFKFMVIYLRISAAGNRRVVNALFGK